MEGEERTRGRGGRDEGRRRSMWWRGRKHHFLSGDKDKSDAAAGDKRKEGGLNVKG